RQHTRFSRDWSSDVCSSDLTIVISEVFGVNKPDPRIFEYALTNGETHKEVAIMIGDNIDADVRGATRMGMDAIFFNPLEAQKPDDVQHMIKDLKDLQSLF